MDQFEGQCCAGKELKGLTADIGRHLFGLGPGEAPGPYFHEGQVHQEPQVSYPAVLLADGGARLIGAILSGQPFSTATLFYPGPPDL